MRFSTAATTPAARTVKLNQLPSDASRRRENVQGVERIIVIESRRPLSPLSLDVSTASKRCLKILSLIKLAKPNARAAARMNLSLLMNLALLRTLTPLVTTLENKKVVTPPRTGAGMARNTPESLPRTPKRMRKKQHHLPAVRLAQRVMAITPLF